MSEGLNPQRFGRIIKNFGDFGELRQQKKPPHTQVLYIFTKMPAKFPIGGSATSRENEVLRAIVNCTNEQIVSYIQKLGLNLSAGNISQENTEFLLDWSYAELSKRITE